MTKNLRGLYKETTFHKDIKFLNRGWRIWNSLTTSADHFGMHALVIFRPQYEWFLLHLYVGLILSSNGQLAELIAYIIPLEYICIVNISYWLSPCPEWSLLMHIKSEINHYALPNVESQLANCVSRRVSDFKTYLQWFHFFIPSLCFVKGDLNLGWHRIKSAVIVSITFLIMVCSTTDRVRMNDKQTIVHVNQTSVRIP